MKNFSIKYLLAVILSLCAIIGFCYGFYTNYLTLDITCFGILASAFCGLIVGTNINHEKEEVND